MEIADGAIDFMERSASAKKAFYAYVPYTLVHYPTLPSAEFKGLTGSGDWADCLAQMDHNVGRLLDSIERLGLRDDTIVVFTSDNGADTSTQHKRGSAGPWAGTMFTPMEGSNRVPFIIRWPGRIGADRETDAIVHEVDTFTTLLRFAGAAFHRTGQSTEWTNATCCRATRDPQHGKAFRSSSARSSTRRNGGISNYISCGRRTPPIPFCHWEYRPSSTS